MPIRLALGSPAEEFHLASANPASRLRSPRPHEINYDEAIKELARHAALHLDGTPRVALPSPDLALETSLEQAIVSRRSGRIFAPRPLSPERLAKLLFLANGIREDDGPGGAARHRNAPSGGGLGSVEIHCVALDVAGVDPGIYHFDSVRHDLALVRAGQFRGWLRECVLFQREVSDASVALVLTCAMGRLSTKYGLRGYRLGLLDAGHVSQNLYLVATALGLEVCALSGFVDDELNRALGLDGLERCAVLVLVVGPRAD